MLIHEINLQKVIPQTKFKNSPVYRVYYSRERYIEAFLQKSTFSIDEIDIQKKQLRLEVEFKHQLVVTTAEDRDI